MISPFKDVIKVLFLQLVDCLVLVDIKCIREGSASTLCCYFYYSVEDSLISRTDICEWMEECVTQFRFVWQSTFIVHFYRLWLLASCPSWNVCLLWIYSGCPQKDSVSISLLLFGSGSLIQWILHETPLFGHGLANWYLHFPIVGELKYFAYTHI